jgi:hypothetical protein
MSFKSVRSQLPPPPSGYTENATSLQFAKCQKLPNICITGGRFANSRSNFVQLHCCENAKIFLKVHGELETYNLSQQCIGKYSTLFFLTLLTIHFFIFPNVIFPSSQKNKAYTVPKN